MENLRLFLEGKKQSDPYFYGSEYKAAGGYNSGGPGYAISGENLGKLIQSFNKDGCSKASDGPEDIEIAKCLKLVGIKVADTRDARLRFRFHPFEPIHMIHAQKLLPQKYNWWWGFTAHKLSDGLECCSDGGISFHYISPDLMRVMEYLIYYLAPFTGRETDAEF